METDQETGDNEVLGIEQVDMMVIKRLLIEQVKHNSLIEAWLTTTEEEFKREIVRDVCQIDIFLGSHRPDFFARLLEICDKWDQHFKIENTSNFEKGESSSVCDTTVEDLLEQTTQGTA